VGHTLKIEKYFQGHSTACLTRDHSTKFDLLSVALTPKIAFVVPPCFVRLREAGLLYSALPLPLIEMSCIKKGKEKEKEGKRKEKGKERKKREKNRTKKNMLNK
jgi:hypothetical protein